MSGSPARPRFEVAADALPARRALRAESAIVGVAVAIAGLVVSHLLLVRDVVAPYPLRTLADAWSVWHGASGSALSHDSAPALLLFQLPLARSTFLTQELLLLPAFSVLLAGLLAALGYEALVRFGVRPASRVIATVLLMTNPALLYLAVSGLPTIGGMLAVAIGAGAIALWARHGSLLWLLAASVSLALGVLAWYPVLVWALVALVAVLCVLLRAQRPRSEVIGVLMVFAAPIVFSVALWTALTWNATGTPPAWWRGADIAAALVRPSGATFALLLPGCVAMALAIVVHRRRPSVLIIAGLCLGALAAAAFTRLEFDPDAPGSALLLLPALAPAVATVVAAAMLSRLRPRARSLGSLVLLVAVVGAHATQLDLMRSAPDQPAVQRFARSFTGSSEAAQPSAKLRMAQQLDEAARRTN